MNRKLCWGLLLCAVANFGAMQGTKTPISHLIARQYQNGYQAWLHKHKALHSATHLSAYISLTLEKDLDALAKRFEECKMDLQLRILTKAVPFDVTDKAFNTFVAYTLQLAEIDVKYLNLKIQHLQELKKEVDDEKEVITKMPKSKL